MAPATREQHEDISFHYMSLIEKPECHDGSGEICQILILNEIYTILDIISSNYDKFKAVYKSAPSRKPRTYLSMSQRHSIKFLQYYNIKQCRAQGSFPFSQWLIVIREEFETFCISCNTFD